VRAKVVKNKVAPPFRQAEFDLMYGSGISKEGSILDLGVEEGLVAKSGAWYTYGEDRLGQGREAAKEFLRENPDLRDEIEAKLRVALDLPVNVTIAVPAAETAPATGKAPAAEKAVAVNED
jgi:recombination protein RecA